MHNHDFYQELPDSMAYRGGHGNRYYGAFQPGPPLRQTYPRRPYGQWGVRRGAGGYWGGQQSETGPPGAGNKRKVMVTVIRASPAPRASVKILLNRWGVHSYEQLVKDISDAFGPKWKGNKIRKLFTIKGREVQGVSDFFRDDEVFIGCGNETLTTTDVSDIIDEVYPDSPQAQQILKEWEKQKKVRGNRQYVLKGGEPEEPKKDSGLGKKDSGLGSDSSNTNREEPGDNEIIYKGRPAKKKKAKGLEAEEQVLERPKAVDDRSPSRRKLPKLDGEKGKGQTEDDKRKKQVRVCCLLILSFNLFLSHFYFIVPLTRALVGICSICILSCTREAGSPLKPAPEPRQGTPITL